MFAVALCGDVTASTKDPRLIAYVCRECDAVALAETPPECCEEEMWTVETDAVDDPDLSVLLHHVYGLSGSGVDICVSLLQGGEATAADLASDIGVNRSTVSRQLTQLQELGVVEYREESVAGGGRVKQYSPVSLDELRQRHREGLLLWASDAMAIVDQLDGEKLIAAARGESVTPPDRAVSDE